MVQYSGTISVPLVSVAVLFPSMTTTRNANGNGSGWVAASREGTLTVSVNGFLKR